MSTPPNDSVASRLTSTQPASRDSYIIRERIPTGACARPGCGVRASLASLSDADLGSDWNGKTFDGKKSQVRFFHRSTVSRTRFTETRLTRPDRVRYTTAIHKMSSKVARTGERMIAMRERHRRDPTLKGNSFIRPCVIVSISTYGLRYSIK